MVDAMPWNSMRRSVNVPVAETSMTRRLWRDMDRDVIGSVTCEAVNLMHDAVGHVVGFDVLDHPHEFRAVGLPGRLTGVDELFDHDRAEVAGFAQIRFALSRNREAFVTTSAFSLLFRGDA